MLLDSGNGKRLEELAGVRVQRPCPSATYATGLSSATWESATGKFVLSTPGSKGSKGAWEWSSPPPEDWAVSFEDVGATFSLANSENGQLGVFAEQHDNWRFIHETLTAAAEKQETPAPLKVLNGFAYTGGSTMAARHAAPGLVEAVHLDGAASACQWARRNAEHAGLATVDSALRGAAAADGGGVRFIAEDCMTFLQREIKRGNAYDLLIFDPPAFGRGGKGKKMWKLNEPGMIELAEAISSLLTADPAGVVISCHDATWPPRRLENLLCDALASHIEAHGGDVVSGFMKIPVTKDEDGEDGAKKGRALLLGGYARWRPKRLE